MKFFKSDEHKINVCIRRSIFVVGETEKGQIRYPYEFKFCGVIELPYEPLVGDIVSYDRFVDLGEVQKRRIYRQGNNVNLKYYEGPTETDNPFNLELQLKEDMYRMWEEAFEDNPTEDIHRFWLTLIDQFHCGFGMEPSDFHRFDQFTDEWFPKFEKKGLV